MPNKFFRLGPDSGHKNSWIRGPADVNHLGLPQINLEYLGFIGLSWNTLDYRIAADYSDILGVFRIIPIHCGLLWNTPDHEFGSPSGPADCQSCFPLGITPNYSDFLRITPNYFGLLWFIRISADYSDNQLGSPSGPADYQSCFRLGITVDYCEMSRITPDYTWLLRFTSDYSG